MSRALKLPFFLACALLAASAGANPRSEDSNVISDSGDERVMLRGNDPVAYFTQNKALKGDRRISAEHDGVTYRFANEEHRKMFLASPERYVPQYGGFCANGIVYAIPLGGGENFSVIDGKLYIFGGIGSKLYFEMDLERNRRLADGYWANEVKGKNWRVQSRNRIWGERVPHYKTNRELAAEYERRFGKKPGE